MAKAEPKAKPLSNPCLKVWQRLINLPGWWGRPKLADRLLQVVASMYIAHWRLDLENVKKNIALGSGPVSSFNSKKASKALQLFSSWIQPLNQLLESLFEVFPLLEFEKYQKVYEHTFPERQVPIDSPFGLSNSQGFVINTVTNVHWDLYDVCRGCCAITPFGHFQAGYACFRQPGLKFQFNVGKC